jgi:penicillin-binding protein 1A
MDEYGIDVSVEAARRLGIQLDENKQYGLSLALGATEVPLMQMTNAYAAFANQGQQYNPTVVKSIKNKFDNMIFTANDKPRTAISVGGAFLISSILSDNNARAPIFGSSLTVPGRTAAVKTGTTDDARDAWTIGYTPQLAVGVWVGNNNNAVMQNGGSSMAGPIWVNTMKQALNGVQNTPFTQPSDVIQKPVCYGGGLANSSGTNTYDEFFLASALPTKTCNAQQKQQEPEKKPEEESTAPVVPQDNNGNGTGNDGEDSGEGNNEPDPNDPGNGGGETDPGTGEGNGSGSGGGTGTTPPGGGTLLP